MSSPLLEGAPGNREPNTAPASPATIEEVEQAMSAMQRYKGPNPFISRTPLGAYEIIKIIFFIVTGLALVRVILVFLCVLLMVPFSFLATCCHSPTKPLGCFRSIWVYPIRFLIRIMLFVLGFYYIPTSTPKKKGPAANIIVANHVSLIDALPIIYSYGCSAAAKKEVFGLPMVGSLLKAFQSIPIDRTTPEGRKRAVEDLNKRAKDKSFPPLLVFPQGTTATDNIVTMFKPGAFLTGEPVQPVCLRFSSNTHFDLFLSHSMPWVLFHTCCQFVNFLSIEYLDVYEPSEEEKKNPPLYANRVRKRMVEKMPGVTTTEHSFDDVLLQHHARKAGVSVDFEMDPLTKLVKIHHKDILPYMEKFRNMGNNGLIDFNSFCDALALTEDSPLRKPAYRLFQKLDNDGDGVLNFGDFVMGMAVFEGRGSPQDSALALFAICDLDGDGVVSKTEFEEVLNLAVSRPGPHDAAKATPEGQSGEEGEGKAPGLVRLYSLALPQGSGEEGIKAAVKAVFEDRQELGAQAFAQSMQKNADVAKSLMTLFLKKYT